jgi:hypothetical protein
MSELVDVILKNIAKIKSPKCKDQEIEEILETRWALA